MDAIFSFGWLLVLLGLGYFVGTARESQHYKSIVARENILLNLPAVPMQNVLEKGKPIADAQLVTGNVVISVDYFKRMLAGLRNLFGGRVIAYETLVDRARREAVLRMKETAKGAHIIVNLRVETSAIGQRSGKNRSIGSIEAIAYGTAVTYSN